MIVKYLRAVKYPEYRCTDTDDKWLIESDITSELTH